MATQFLTEALGTDLGSPAMGGLPKLPAAEKRIGPSPEEDIARAESEIKSTLTKREDLTEKLGKAVIAKADYDLKEKAFAAEQQSQAAKKSKTLLDDLESKFANSPEYKEYQANADKTAEELTFKPSQENAQTLALVFSVISASGFLLGGLNKKNALSAMYAMNGLTEGYAKGREDLFKQQRQTFETNVKAMQDRMKVLKDKLDVGIKTLARDKERGELEIQAAMAEANADFLKSQKDARGVIATREILENQIKQLDKSLDFLKKSEEKYKAQQLQGYWNQERLNMQERLNAATNDTRIRLAEDAAKRASERSQEASQRASERAAQSREFQMEMLRLRQDLKSGQKDDDDRQKMGAVEARTLRDTRKLQGDMSSLIDDLQNPALIKQIDDNRAYAFLSEESKVLDQLLAKKLPPELQSFLLKVRSVRNKYYLDTSGKAVTGGEALRNYGVVAQPGDTAERARQKLEIGLGSVEESIKDFQATYKVPKALQERLGEGRVDFATMEEYEKAKKGLKDGQKVRVAGRNAVHQAEK
jgi:hypothetical protein